MAIEDPIYASRINKLTEKANFHQYWIVSRHRYYYKWLFLGCFPLPNDFPFHKSPFCPDSNQITN